MIYLPLLYDPLAKYALLREAAFRSLFQNQFEIWSAGKCHSEQLMRTQSKNKRIAHRVGKRQDQVTFGFSFEPDWLKRW